MVLELVQHGAAGINQEALDEFIEHRVELKKPMTPLAIKKAEKILIRHTLDHQQYMVDTAILSGWRGLWEVEPRKQVSSKSTTIEHDLEDKTWAL